MRLRPFGKSARLVLPLSEFQKYSQSDSCQLWERQAFTRARVVRSDGDFGRKVTDTVKSAITAMAGNAAMAADIRSMRARLDASPGNLKRGPGGIVDIEFIVQLLQLKYGVRHPDILAPNLFDALDAIERHRLLSSTEVFDLRAAYAVLRKTESRLRIVTDKPLTELPEEAFANDTLARRLGFETTGQATATERFRRELTALMTRVRELFQTITVREQSGD
jgi:glutamate-ammonia-ligase adenylyltransferase